MILDSLSNLNRYFFPQTKNILEFISTNDCLFLPNEQINIDGDELFVKVMEYLPKPENENKFEAHQIYADLQYVVSGIELMQTTVQENLQALTKYDPKGDYQFFAADKAINNFVVKSGEFAIFYPGEAHKPSCLYQNQSVKVKKLVFKIKIK